MLIGIFVVDKLEVGILTDPLFWSQKILTGLATFAIMIATSNITEEALKKHDKDYIERLDAIDTNYALVNTNFETDQLERFLTNINIANKYKCYVSKYKNKLKHARKESKRKEIEEKLLLSPQEVWDSAEKVKYFKVTYNQLMSGAFDVSPKNSEYDLNVHKVKFGLQQFLWKIVAIVAFGGLTGELVFSMIDFTPEMIMQLIIKAITILTAVYTGICFGYSTMDRIKTVLKSKVRILSQFRGKIERNEDLTVELDKDVAIEKIKAKVQSRSQIAPMAVKQAVKDTFGSGVPVKSGALLQRVLNNALQYEAELNND